MRPRSLLTVLVAFSIATTAQAIPVLQIYFEDATFDANSETWIITNSDFKLWVVGDVDAQGPILNAKLTVSFFGLAGTISFTPATTSRIPDSSPPPDLAPAGSGTGGHPVLPPHGIFNDVTLHHWEDLAIGNLALTDSPIGDYNGSTSFPSSLPDHGEVAVYDVHVTGWNKVHFDAYGITVDTLNGHEATWKTPGSHDGQVPVEQSTWGAVKSLFLSR